MTSHERAIKDCSVVSDRSLLTDNAKAGGMIEYLVNHPALLAALIIATCQVLGTCIGLWLGKQIRDNRK